MYVLTNNRYKTYRTNLCSVAWVIPLGWVETGGAGDQKLILSEHGHVAYQIDGDDE